ncbi:MAG: alpha/beta hydrolase, partial [Leptospiraceae bacterium]|nr:alpha/beta hydrolase [Leptospiraceae bacterium]
AIIRTTSAALSTAVPTISLNQLFQFLHSLTGVKGLTFTLGKKLLTLRDFVGYRQITSPEWYLTLEDIFCKESLMSITQFLKAQIEGVGFYSFDKKINYTEDQINFSLPLFTIVGEEDTIAPPDTVIAGNDLVVSENRKIRSYPQGHLGIIIHPPTVQQIATDALDWIKTL